MKDNKHIKKITQDLLEYSKEIKAIYLVSVKVDTSGELTSFKLGLIVSNDVFSTSEYAAKLYMQIDCDLPYDIIVYTEEKFSILKEDTGTFANKILEKGTMLYGQRLS